MTDLALQLIQKNIKKHQRGKDATYLDLGRCGLTHLPPELEECIWVETLILSNEWGEYDLEKMVQKLKLSQNQGEPNRIASIKGVEKLLDLKKLVVAQSDFYRGEKWEVSDLSPLAALSQLQMLDCTNTQVGDLSPLAALSQLQTLHCSITRVSDLSPLAGLSQLQTLHCSATPVSDLSPLAALSQLQTLICYSTQISDLSPLAALSQLQTLDCFSTRVSDLSPLAALSQLQTLDCSRTQVSDLSPLAALSQLQTLHCSRTQVSDLSPLAALSQLQTLHCAATQVSDLSPLAALSQLQTLNCSLILTSDLSPLAALSQLQTLNCSVTPVSDLFPLAALSQLQTLDCSDTQVSDLSPLIALSQLQTLNCFDTRVSDLSPLLPLIRKGVPVKWAKYESSGIIVGDCPLTNPPREIVEQGNEAILNYFAEKERLEKVQNQPALIKVREANVLIVGQGKSGKTTLRKKLEDPDAEMPAPGDTTRGIEITRLSEQMPHTGEPLRLNLWDFGGQDIQHYAHQFFLTGNSLYTLVTNERIQDSVHLPYWLNIIEMLGKKSPVILVQNKDGDNCQALKDEAAIRARFPNVHNKVYQSDFSKAKEEEEFGKLRKKIIELASELPHIEKFYLRSFLELREKLENEAAKGTHYLRWSEYLALMPELNQDLMHTYANALTFFGDCQYFEQDAMLRQYVFLRPKWLIDALFELLLHDHFKTTRGTFTENDTFEIWKGPEYAGMHTLLVRMMKEFELCYRVEGDEERFIVPQRLPGESKTYGWSEKNDIPVQFRYKFMPKGILTRLICRLHPRIERDDVLGQRVWNDAVIFTLPNGKGRVFVREVYAENIIELRSVGEKHEEMLNEVIRKIDDINSDRKFENLQVEKMVPCPCAECKANEDEDPGFHEFDALQKRIDKGKTTSECKKSGEDVSIDEIFGKSGIPRPASGHRFGMERTMGLDEGLFAPSFPLKALPPVVFAAFANPKGDLHGLSDEQRGIQDALRSLQAKGAINCTFRTDTDRTDYFDYLRDWQNQISLFHYAGHANHKGLSLQDIHADFKPLADELLLRNKESLCVVVLNGCSTQAHVKGLLEQGVKAVIATSSSVGDTIATEFAIRFYANLAKGDPLKVAYESAAHFAKAGNGEKRFQHWGKVLRDFGFDDTNPADEFPWGLYISDDERVLQYTLCGGMPY